MAQVTKQSFDLHYLHGRRAVVTGAAGGIGRSIVDVLHSHGAEVYAIDWDAQKLNEMKQRYGATFDPHVVDLESRDATDAISRVLDSRIGDKLDILVNNAGISAVVGFDETDDVLLDRLFSINFNAAFRITRSLLPKISNSSSPSIVNIASELALVGQWGYSAYSATKGAMLAWSRTLAVELAPKRIRVNAICPGPIDTAMLNAEFALSDNPSSARLKEISTVPIGRLGRPEDIAAIVAFLASPAAGFVTGAAWTADGGKTSA